jgi:hypothetical protein
LESPAIRLVARRKVAARLAAAALIGSCLCGLAVLVAHQRPRLFLAHEAAYADTYIFYDANRYLKTGVMYPDMSEPPYLPAQYSPGVYFLLSLPGRFFDQENPWLGPRLVVLASFLLCAATAASITRVLVPVKAAWVWAALLAGSTLSFRNWVLALRGDFPGILFSLLAIRLLLARPGWAVFAAGIAAGLATQFKLTFVSALAAGGVWLLLRRRWKDLGAFAAAGALASAGLYLLVWLREPRMLSHILSLKKTLTDLQGWTLVLQVAAREPVVLLAATALPLLSLRLPRWRLLALFSVASLGIAVVTELQSGGNVNYFFEWYFALVPAAVFGVLRLLALAGRHAYAGMFVASVFALMYFMPALRELNNYRGPSQSSAAPANERFRIARQALEGRHILSTVPRLALFDPRPAMTEPFYFAHADLLGLFDLGRVADRVRAQEFEVVATASPPLVYRGIPLVAPRVRAAIAEAYRPYCMLGDALMHLPRKASGDPPVAEALRRAGCQAVVCDAASGCPSW